MLFWQMSKGVWWKTPKRKNVERKTSNRKVIGMFLIRHYRFDIFFFDISLFSVFHHTRQKYRRIYKCIYLSRDLKKSTKYSVLVNWTSAIVNTTYFQMQRTNRITWARCNKTNWLKLKTWMFAQTVATISVCAVHKHGITLCCWFSEASIRVLQIEYVSGQLIIVHISL